MVFHAVASPRLVVRLYWSGGGAAVVPGVAGRLGRVEGHALPGTWWQRALCVLDRVEGYRERTSPEGVLGYASGSVGWG
jgi:hypothetical protein